MLGPITRGGVTVYSGVPSRQRRSVEPVRSGGLTPDASGQRPSNQKNPQNESPTNGRTQNEPCTFHRIL